MKHKYTEFKALNEDSFEVRSDFFVNPELYIAAEQLQKV